MKYHTVCFLILWTSLVSADFFDQGGKSNLFAPLSDTVRPVIFKGVDQFVTDTITEISQLSLSEQTSLLSQLRHSYSQIGSSLNLTLEGVEWFENVNFYEKLHNFIDLVTDTEILYNTSIQYNQEIQETSHINSKNSLKYENYLRLTANSSFKNDDLEIILNDIINTENDNFIIKLYKTIQQNICALQTSPQQAVGNFLGHVGLYVVQTQLTHFLNTQISEKIRQYYEWDLPLTSDKSPMYEYYSKFYKQTRQGLTASQEFSPCLPQTPVEGSTYLILRNPFKNFTTEELNAKCHISPRPYCNNLNKNIDRYVSLKPVYSNIYNNSVITGIRFVEKNHILHIQIQQGQLLKNGNVNSKTVAWVPIDDNVICGSSKDCYFLNSKEPHIIDLGDTLMNPSKSKEKKVLTGIRFTAENKYNPGHLRLLIYGTPFDFAKGQLITDYEVNTQLPEDKAYDTVPFEKSVRLTSIAKNNKEHMSPYINIQSVETKPPAAMVGAGIFTQTMNGSKLLSLKLFTYDIDRFVKGVK